MAYPKIVINLSAMEYNTRFLMDYFQKKGIEIAFVTKVYCGDERLASVLSDCNVRWLADSRIENLESMNDFAPEKILLRLPMRSEVEQVVKYADISLNSSIDTIHHLSEEAVRQGKVHKVILMLDMGDLREGIFEESEMFEIAEKILQMKGIEFVGVGTNLTCYGGVIPSKENLGRLVDIKNRMEERFGIRLPIVSGGNSSSVDLLMKEEVPGVTQLRLGEISVLGRETAYGEHVLGLREDVFRMEAEIIEIYEKPSVPIGEIGMDAFGNHPIFKDHGNRKRAIIAIGRQDVSYDALIPKDSEIHFIGGSSDHTILDVTDSKSNYNVGDVLKFDLTYGSILSLMTSKYVHREYVRD